MRLHTAFVTKILHMVPFHAAEHPTHRFFAKLESNSGGCAKVEIHATLPAWIQIRALYRQSGSDRLEKQPTDLRRHHHYMRYDALGWTRFKNRSFVMTREHKRSLQSMLVASRLTSTSSNEYRELFQTPIRAAWSYLGRSHLCMERLPIQQCGSSGENRTTDEPGRSAR